jgi:hypothetical protein
MQISASIDTTKLTRDLQRWQKQHVPLAIAKALTFTAKAVQRELVGEMGRVFDRPTRRTLGGTWIKAATPQSMVAIVKIKDDAVGGPNKTIAWLGHHITGGGRAVKRSEQLLRQQGILGNDEFIVPGAAATLDAHGNISRGLMQKILSRVGASFDALTRAKGKVSRVRGQSYSETYFYLREPHGRLTRRGIYRRIVFPGTGLSKVEPVLIFVKRVRYRRRLRFFEIADQVFQLRYPLQLKIELERAIRAGAAKHII